MAMVNPMLNIATNSANVKDSRWLTLEVCREYQRNKCTRSDTECKFAHPPAHVEVQNGRVTACFDSIKGKCQRKDPPCKYLHPPQHLREQLLQNGRNNLILRNLQMQAQSQLAALQPIVPGIPVAATKQHTMAAYPAVLPGQIPVMVDQNGWMSHLTNYKVDQNGWMPHLTNYKAHPYLTGSVPTSAVAGFNPYISQTVPTVAVQSGTGSDGSIVQQQIPGVIPATIPSVTSQQKVARADRLEVCREFQRGTCTRQPSECRYAHPPENVTVDTSENQVTVCMDYVKGKCTRDSCKYFHPPPHLQAQIKAAQQRANTNSAAAQALPQVVEVIPGKKRPRDHADDLVLQSAIPGMIPYKRVAVEHGKSGLPVYQPNAANIAAYQQIAAMHQLQQQQQYLPVPVTLPMVVTPAPEAATTAALVAAPAGLIPTNAHSVNYFDSNQQLLDTLPACRDFKVGLCNRPQCKYVHVLEDYVEVMDGRVTVCRDSVRGKCSRPMCKYYHIPVPLPPSK